jgi:hypothetical protein
MAKTKVELNLQGLRAVMKSPEMQAALTAAGNAISSSAGGGYKVRTHIATYTALCDVSPDTDEARKRNYEENSLLKATGSAGLRMKG